MSRLNPIGRLPASQQMKLAIGVPLRDPQGMSNLLEQLYDPASANYHHFQTVEQFTEMFGPTEQDYQTVIEFAKAHGLKVGDRHSNRLLVEVNGSVAAIEQAFQVKMNVYQHPRDARTFFAPDVEPSVKRGTPILDVDGLNSYYKPRPKLRVKLASTNSAMAKVGSGPNNNGYMGSDYRAAYVPGITNTGVGQSVALVEFDGYYTNDIRIYETNARLSTTIVVTNVYVNGFNGVPSSGANAFNSEVALDIEMAISMAPGCRVIVYEEPPNEEPAGNILWNKIAVDNTAKQISCSWEVPVNGTTDNIFQEFAMQGQSLFDASGDDGAYVGEIPPPSEDPYITQVGGTTLTTSGVGGPWASETTWDTSSTESSSGGVSDLYLIPSWQKGINMTGNMGSFTRRNFPDVAAVADDIFIVADNGQLESIVGTSAAAPLWAGFTALVNQQAAINGHASVGFLNPAVYQIGLQSSYGANFHDVTTGNNVNGNGVSEFFATTGYDLCTGLGTPIGATLFNTLLASPDVFQIAQLQGFTAAGTVGGPFNLTSQTYVLTNTGSATIGWTSFVSASWLSVSMNGGTLPSGGSTAVTVTLNSAASNLTAGIYSASVWFTNESSQLGISRQFSLQVGQPIVQNGSFETGDFAHWVLAGDSYYNFVDNGHITGESAESGSYFAIMGPTNLPLATLTQTIPTIIGQTYVVSFWVRNPNFGNGTTPNQLFVSWNGTNIFNQTNLPTLSTFTNIQLGATASSPTTDLQFGFRNDVGDFVFDNVSVTIIPTPSIRSVKRIGGGVTLTWNAVANQLYEVQYKTNYLQTNWTPLVTKLTASGPVMSATDPVATDRQRFYRVLLLP